MIFTSKMGQIHLTVQGVQLDNVSWDKWTGGGTKNDMTKRNPGNQAPQVALGGLRKRDDVTLERGWDDFLIGIAQQLDSASSWAPCIVSFTPMRGDRKTSASKPFTLTGVLGDITWPDIDSESATAQVLTAVISTNDSISFN